MAIDTAAARGEVLRRIRAALGEPEMSAEEEVRAEWEAIPRGYRRQASLGRAEVIALLEDRLLDYDAHVERVQPGDVSATMARLLRGRGVKRLLVPAGFADALGGYGQAMPEGYEYVEDAVLSAEEMNALDGVLTTAQVAIAGTGTLVVQVVPGQGRRAATLIPDYHLCVLREEDVVETVPEAIARLDQTATLATTFISGPSATADIEMTRIKGVHGPRFLDVIVVGERGGPMAVSGG